MWALPHLLSITSFLLALVFVSKVLRERRPPGTTLAWLLIIILIPYVGIPMYLIIGERKLSWGKRKSKHLYSPVSFENTPHSAGIIERILLSSGNSPHTQGNTFQLLETGDSAYQEILKIVEKAKTSIHVMTFILRDDKVGHQLLEALIAKAKSGVQVRVLADGFGSFLTRKKFFTPLIEAGGKFSFFSSMVGFPLRRFSNLRNHRKVIVVDGLYAITGGMNLTADYMGPENDPKRWVDLSMLIEGPAVKDLEKVFISDWHFTTHEHLKSPHSHLHSEKEGNETLQIIASGPDVPADTLYDSTVSGIFSAQKSVWIATPYFIPDETLARALELAAKRGVDVRIAVPYRSNHRLADLARKSYLRQIHDAGGKIHFFTPNMMHAKATIIDHSFAILGSANMDMRSLLLNYEIGVLVYSKGALNQVVDWYHSILKKTIHSFPKARYASSWLDGIGRILGPML